MLRVRALACSHGRRPLRHGRCLPLRQHAAAEVKSPRLSPGARAAMLSASGARVFGGTGATDQARLVTSRGHNWAKTIKNG